jgi:hypothetical protein
VQRRRAVGHHVIIRHTALRPNGGGHIVGPAMAKPAVQIGTDHGVAMIRQPPAELLIELIPAGHVVNGDDAREGTVALRARDIGMDQIAIAGRVGRDARDHPTRFVGNK